MAQLWTQPTTGSVPGLDAIQELMGAGLVHKNDKSIHVVANEPSVGTSTFATAPLAIKVVTVCCTGMP